MPQIIDNTNGSVIGRCLVFYRNGDEPWRGGMTSHRLSSIREALTYNESNGKSQFDQYRLELLEASESDWKERDEELEEKLIREKRERGGATCAPQKE